MYKFAVLPYVNAAPLTHFIPRLCRGAELIYRTPRNTLSELIDGTVDAAIIPVIDYFNTPGLEMVRELGICANGNVESVLLQCKNQLKNVKAIKLDPASRTSNVLLKVLAHEHLPVGLDAMLGEDIENPDGVVMIGDRALCAKPSFESYDLSGQWKEMTGLPFVFAVWAYRTGHPDDKRLIRILHAAKQAGCSAVCTLSRIYAPRLGISEKRCHHYLEECIHYNVGRGEEAGMQLFRQMSMDCMSKSRLHIKTIDIQNLKDTVNVGAPRQFA